VGHAFVGGDGRVDALGALPGERLVSFWGCDICVWWRGCVSESAMKQAVAQGTEESESPEPNCSNQRSAAPVRVRLAAHLVDVFQERGVDLGVQLGVRRLQVDGARDGVDVGGGE